MEFVSPSPSFSLRVAFSGHRLQHLLDQGSDLELLQNQCGKVLDLLSNTFDDLCVDLGEGSEFLKMSNLPRIRFSSSLANGGDMLAVSAAVDKECDLHFFLPFPADLFVANQGFSHKETQEFYALWNPGIEASSRVKDATRTEIDLGVNEAQLSAYASCGRLMLDHADVLIVLWDGKSDNGAGGTRDVMRDAQRRQLTTIRVSLDGSIGVWLPDDDASDPSNDGVFSDAEDIRNVMDSSIEALLDRELRRILLPYVQNIADELEHEVHLSEGPLKLFWKGMDWLSAAIAKIIPTKNSEEYTPAAKLRSFKNRTIQTWTVFSGWPMLQTFFGVQPMQSPIMRFGQRDDQSWSKLEDHCRLIGGANFSKAVAESVYPLWRRADHLAVYFSLVFRSAYILSFFLSVLAVASGLLILFESDKAEIYDLKGLLVSLELGLLLTILLLVFFGTRQRWKEKWIIHRNFAEFLRASRLNLLLGSAPIDLSQSNIGKPDGDWLQWYANSCLRAIPPPTGCITPDQLRTAIDYSISQELNPQILYHQRTSERMRVLDHRMHVIASLLLVITILGGLLYLVLLNAGYAEYYKPLKPYITFFGGVLPVCGAAINGIRATGDFRTTADQSKRTAAILAGIKTHLEAERGRDEPRRFHVRALFGRAISAMSYDLDVWSLIYHQRELGPGIG